MRLGYCIRNQAGIPFPHSRTEPRAAKAEGGKERLEQIETSDAARRLETNCSEPRIAGCKACANGFQTWVATGSLGSDAEHRSLPGVRIPPPKGTGAAPVTATRRTLRCPSSMPDLQSGRTRRLPVTGLLAQASGPGLLAGLEDFVRHEEGARPTSYRLRPRQSRLR